MDKLWRIVKALGVTLIRARHLKSNANTASRVLRNSHGGLSEVKWTDGRLYSTKISLSQLFGIVIAKGHCSDRGVAGWRVVLTPLFGLPALLLVQMLALLILTHIVRALRLYSYFFSDIKRRFGLMLAIMLTNLFNHLLPARLGEASLPLLLRRHVDVDLLRGTSALLWFRFLDLHTLVTLAVVAVFVVPESTSCQSGFIFSKIRGAPSRHYLSERSY